ncbi:hypothetical protein Glove_669g2 [Diversispora epigaea]|uniref:Small ribosomal subunit protein uS7 domain-containing protein n=1 Tax=Diversispora epigaea TaxID=1348612 RepID=A0A397GBV7_9GLOM|nr:hypothetical protein Glove_669g2 [Diversispora epigaea]
MYFITSFKRFTLKNHQSFIRSPKLSPLSSIFLQFHFHFNSFHSGNDDGNDDRNDDNDKAFQLLKSILNSNNSNDNDNNDKSFFNNIERINSNTNPVLDDYKIKPELKSNISTTEENNASNIDIPDVQLTKEEDPMNLLDITDDIDVSSSEINNEMTDPIIIQLTNMIMRDGKKARAQRYVADCCLEIRKQTNNNPYRIIKASIEKTSPLVRLIGYKQGSKNIQIPIPLNERQKRHKAIKWILSASDKRPGKKFSERLALEILAVINGQSPALQQRESVHKSALVNRANLPVKW